jgi:predicted acyltransferase
VGLGHTVPERIRKLAGWGLLIAAIAWFVLDFQYFQTPHPPSTGPEGSTHSLRIPGVLQRIALCYLIASIIVLLFGVTGRAMWTALLLGGYWWIVENLAAPASYTSSLLPGRELGRLHDWLDM